MAHPLLLIKKLNDGSANFISAMEKFKKKSKAKKKAKATKKKPVVKKKAKPVEPPRQSPFAVGDEVWAYRSSIQGYVKTKITTCIRPTNGNKQWHYNFESELVGQSTEAWVLPTKIFTLMAVDASKMKDAGFTNQLNEIFDASARIVAVYRQGQSRPWAYYVIPDPDVLYKRVQWVAKVYGYNQDMEDILYVQPNKNIDMKLLPISSAPQEILTYLGLHIYNRKWKRDEA